MRTRAPAIVSRVVVASALASVLAVGGCLLTSDFDGVAGVRPSTEAGPDEAGADADAGSSSPCAAGDHVVCTDFDHAAGSFPPPGWNNNVGDGGAMAMDDTTSVSPPRSLSAKLEGANGPSAFLTRQAFVTSFKTLTVSVDMRIGSCPPQGKSITILYVEPSSRVSFGLVFLSSGVQAVGASVNGAPTFTPLQRPIPEQTWSHVVWKIELRDATTSHLNLTVDGAPSVDTDAPGGTTKASVQLNVGLVGNGVTAPCDVRFDNYVVDKE